MEEKQIRTVQQLIDHLSQFPPDAQVILSCNDSYGTFFLTEQCICLDDGEVYISDYPVIACTCEGA